MSILGGIAYLAIGLAISSYWYRRRRRLCTNDLLDDPYQAFFIVFLWPLFLLGWPTAIAIKWLYTA